MDHDIVVVARATRLCDGCSAGREVLEKQLERAVGVAVEVQASAHESETRASMVLEILHGRWAVVLTASEGSCARSRVPSVPVLVTGFRDFR
jgi:hypothetical protein